MLIQLPVETWIEILDWLKRRDFIKKLDKLWDREFTPIVQNWLHKYTRNVKIVTPLNINNVHGLSIRSCGGPWEKVPIANVELPKNIVSFKRIAIWYLDCKMLAFLRRMRPLFHNFHLGLHYGHEKDSYRTALRFMMSMFNSDSIESMTLVCTFLPFFSINYPANLLNAKLLNMWGIFKLELDISEVLINWLFTPREDSQPRTLVFCLRGNPADFWEKLRERFLDPTRQSASSFFIRIRNAPPKQQMIIENIRTGEKLINGVSPSGRIISNCALNVDQEWLAKKEEEVRKWNFGNQQPLDDEKPGTSQTTAANKRMNPHDDDEEEASSSGEEATSSTGVKRKKLMSDPKEKEKEANDEKTKGLRRSERIKEMKQQLKKH